MLENILDISNLFKGCERVSFAGAEKMRRGWISVLALEVCEGFDGLLQLYLPSVS
jgi:hypothetical protein